MSTVFHGYFPLGSVWGFPDNSNAFVKEQCPCIDDNGKAGQVRWMVPIQILNEQKNEKKKGNRVWICLSHPYRIPVVKNKLLMLKSIFKKHSTIRRAESLLEKSNSLISSRLSRHEYQPRKFYGLYSLSVCSSVPDSSLWRTYLIWRLSSSTTVSRNMTHKFQTMGIHTTFKFDQMEPPYCS